MSFNVGVAGLGCTFRETIYNQAFGWGAGVYCVVIIWIYL